MQRSATPPTPALLQATTTLALGLLLVTGCADGRESASSLRGYTTNVTLGDDDGGGPGCDDTGQKTDVNPRRSLFETSQAALAQLSMEAVLTSMATDAGLTPQAELTHDQFVDTYNEGPGLGLGQHCDDFEAFDGEPGINGYPYESCPRAEGDQIGNLDGWRPIAAVNRFDLAPSDGSHCGEARLVFANNEGGRFFTIFEAQIPNPDPGCGIDACEPVQRFWADLSGNPGKRAQELEAAFISGHPGLLADGFGPFMSQRNMTFGTGQIRTNNFDQGPWSLREFKAVAVADPSTGISADLTKPFEPSVLRMVEVPVAANPFGPLWNDTFVDENGMALPFAETCQQAFVDTVQHLMADDLNLMAVSVPPECLAAESPNRPVMDYAAALLAGGSPKDPDSLQARIKAEILANDPASDLEPIHIARRAEFAGGCIGCHLRSGGVDLGNGVTGIPTGFVHTSEFAGNFGCGDGDSPCFPVSAAVRDEFLPHREAVMEQFLNGGPCCDADTITPISPAEPIAVEATELADIDVAALMDAEALQESLASPVTVSGASSRRSH
ncbi:MAG: hypothetical protein ACRBN8_44090 [Nannocystales bacterium]